jgi:hypothetical protein
MTPPTPLFAAPVNLDAPGRYVHWSIFTISVANLALIAVMVVIFGLALLLPFPGRHHYDEDPSDDLTEERSPVSPAVPDDRDPDTADMWTARIRRQAVAQLHPGKLLPDRQPAYVASWVYVFGVATPAALGMAIVSGFVSPSEGSTGGT